MGFKMNGSPAKMGTIQGTAGHSSALKMKAEADTASALKQMELTKEETKGAYQGGKGADVTMSATGSTITTKDGKKIKTDKSKVTHKKLLDARWKKGDKASGGTLNELVKQRKGVTKGTPEYNKIQNQINAALGSKKRYDEGPTTDETTKTTATEATTKRDNKKVEVQAKYDEKVGEATENKDKGDTKADYKYAKKTFGKGSEEERTAKLNKLIAKEADRQGESGGKKQGIFRKLSSFVNKKRQKNVTKDIADMQMKKQPTSTGEPMDANNSAAKYHSPAKQNIFAEGNNPKKTIDEEASDYRKNTKNRNKTKVDPYTQKYIDYVNTKVGVEGGPKRDKYGNLIKQGKK
jgi:hypothetical protein